MNSCEPFSRAVPGVINSPALTAYQVGGKAGSRGLRESSGNQRQVIAVGSWAQHRALKLAEMECGQVASATYRIHSSSPPRWQTLKILCNLLICLDKYW